MDQESRRKGPRSPSPESDESHRRRSRKYNRSPSPRRSRYRRSRSRDRRSRSSSRDRRRKETSRNQDWKQPTTQTTSQGAPPASSGNYQTPVHNQYQGPPPTNTGQPPPTMAPYNPGYNYNYNYNQSYDYSYAQQPASYRSDYPPPGWQGNQVSYNNQQPPPPPNLNTQTEPPRSVDPGPPGLPPPPITRPEDAKKEAIAAEVKQQKATLGKQREEYIKKSSTLQRELEILRQQCDEISKDGSRDNNRILKENQKLQIEIQNKMKSIHNVIDMLTGIIGDKATVDDLKIKFKLESNKSLKSPKDDFPKGKSESPDRGGGGASVSDSDKESKIDRDRERDKKTPEDMKPMYNFVHYDPEMHWCKVCDIFPKTAKEYLNHLHSNEHKETCVERKIVDMPWHKANGEGTEKEVPYYPGLPTKRTPIKGLQFFISATAWYCKLCDSWIGDLHCASLHLKSKRHSENFSRFVEQNPHWETDWMADREKAFSEEKHKQMQIELLKQKEDEPVTKSKKSKKNKKKSKKSKKRRNKSSGTDTSTDSDDSFSDSDQDKSKSIRVAMRNKMKAATQAILNEEIDYHGIKLKGSWAQVAQQIKQPTPESQQEADDRQLLNSIRDKLKAKQEGEIKAMGSREGNRRLTPEKLSYEEIHSQNPPFPKKPEEEEEDLDAWGPKEPPKSFWIKKEEDKTPTTPNKSIDAPKTPEEVPKPHMGFWTKQQVNMTVIKPGHEIKENKLPESKEEDKNRERGSGGGGGGSGGGERGGGDRENRYKDDRERKYDRREDKYERNYDRYDRRRGRDRDYHEDRRKREASPRRERNWRDSPKGNYDRYEKERREDKDNSSNDESKFEKKTNEFASKFKKLGPQPKKPVTPVTTKGKLPFIGRLPLFKKKTEESMKQSSDKDIAPLPYQQSKFENTPRVPSEIINPPGIVHITKLATPLNINNGNPSQLNKPQHMKILVAPPPPMLHETKLTTLTPQVVDMEIEDQSEGVIIEQPIIIEQQKHVVKNLPKLPPPPSHPPPPINRPPFIPTPHVSTRASFTQNRPAFLTSQPPFFTHPPIRKPPIQSHPFMPMQPPPQMQSNTSFVQSHVNPPPPLPSAETVPHDVSEIPEPAEKRSDSSKALPEDFQEALNIIFPKEEKESNNKQTQQQQESVMYATMYSMLGCIGYGPEYMDQPPPEITQAEPEPDTQPGPDDLKMLGIDEGDTIF